MKVTKPSIMSLTKREVVLLLFIREVFNYSYNTISKTASLEAVFDIIKKLFH